MEEIKLKRRDRNIHNVVQNALIAFIEKGIENAKISDIAELSKLTERSIFRYFETKADLVYETAMLIWHKVVDYINLQASKKYDESMNGKDLVKLVLHEYGNLYFTNKKELIFIHEAESYLYRCGKINIRELSPNDYRENICPLAKAINYGKKDGSIKDNERLGATYYDTYDSLLGLIQKMAINYKENETDEEFSQARIDTMCEALLSLY